MNDLISRQAALEALDQIFDRCEEIEANLPEGDPDRTGYKMYPDYMTVWKYLHQSPSAQPEVIRCKDCKYWDTTWQKDDAPNYHYCPMLDWIREGDFYCADAERRGKQK